MGQTTSSHQRQDHKPQARRKAVRLVGLILVLTAFAGAFLLGLRLGAAHWSLPSWLPGSTSPQPSVNAANPSGSVLYYRDPDGKPIYAAEPRQVNGRPFIAVRAGAELSFDEKPASAGASGNGTTVMSGNKKLLYYRNPMGLPDTSPSPKKDSMGMDYIPVYEGDDDSGTTVTISPGKLQRTGVRSQPATRRVVAQPVRVPGTVQLDERRVTIIATRSDSFIDKVENVTTGDRVRKGQPLLQFYSPEVNAAAAQLITNPGIEGARRRLKNLNVQDETIAEMERTRKVPQSIQWLAPRDGLVLERNAIEGMKAAAGDVLFRIADVSVMWVLADVPEYDLGAIKLGQAVNVRVRSLPGRVFSGRINLIYPQVNKETRTTRVRIELPNPEGLLLPDMYADVEIATGSAKPVVAVPDGAVIDTGTRQVVILDKGEGRFEPREVKIGKRGGGYTEVLSGVAEADQVVVSANFLIDAESNLKAALQGMSDATPASGEKMP